MPYSIDETSMLHVAPMCLRLKGKKTAHKIDNPNPTQKMCRTCYPRTTNRVCVICRTECEASLKFGVREIWCP